MSTPCALVLALAVMIGGLASAATGAPSSLQAAVGSEQHSPNMHQLSEVKLDWPLPVQPDALVDMAFKGRLVVAGLRGTDSDNSATAPNSGSVIFRTTDRSPYLRQLSILPCQASGEVSIIGDVLIAGVVKSHNPARSEVRCNRNGLQIVDISDPRQPQLSRFVELGCGVDIHAVVNKGPRWYVVAPATCDEAVENPTNSGVYAEMAIVRVFPDMPERSQEVGNPGNDSVGCTEVFVLQPRDLLVCLFFETFMIFDISDPVNPVPITGSLGLPNHVMPSQGKFIFNRGSFTWDGQYLVLAGGPVGLDNRCPEEDAPSLFFFNVEDPSDPSLVGDWTVPRRDGTHCFSGGLNILPTKDRDRYLLAAAFGTQGVSVVDFTDPTQPEEIAFFRPTLSPHDAGDTADPDPLVSSRLVSAYWYNGRIYATAEGEGIPRMRVFKVDGLDSGAVRYFRGAYSPQTQIERFR